MVVIFYRTYKEPPAEVMTGGRFFVVHVLMIVRRNVAHCRITVGGGAASVSQVQLKCDQESSLFSQERNGRNGSHLEY